MARRAATRGRKQDVVSFFRRLDDALTDYLWDEKAPLVFAGVDYLFPLYQQANNYAGLADEALLGSPELLSAKQLLEPAWTIVAKEHAARRAATVERFGTAQAQGQGSSTLAEILPAAHIGRFETLLVRRGARQAGALRPETGVVATPGDAESIEEDLLNCAILRTIMASGAVLLLDVDKMPTDEPVAAIYRY